MHRNYRTITKASKFNLKGKQRATHSRLVVAPPSILFVVLKPIFLYATR